MGLSGDDEEGVINNNERFLKGWIGYMDAGPVSLAAITDTNSYAVNLYDALGGNILVAEALLDCKANIEARDKLDDTPLRRAVNCGKTEMVAFLLSRGADAHAKVSRGLAPWQVARGAAMKALLQA